MLRDKVSQTGLLMGEDHFADPRYSVRDISEHWGAVQNGSLGPRYPVAVEYDVNQSVLPLDWVRPQTPNVLVGFHWSEFDIWPELDPAHPVYLADHPELWASPWLSKPDHLYQLTAVVTNPFILTSNRSAIEVFHQNLKAIFEAGYDSVFFQQTPQDPGNPSREFLLFYPHLQIKEVIKLPYATQYDYMPNRVAHYLLPNQEHTDTFNESHSGLVNPLGGWVCQTL